MYKSISIKNFRCFEDITIEPFKRVNLITGLNNAGKTSLLEAIYLSLVPSNPAKLLKLSNLRGIEVLPPIDADILWGDLFFARNYKDNEITITTYDNDSRESSLKIYMSKEELSDIPVEKNQQSLFVTAESSSFNKIEFDFTDYARRKHHSTATIIPSNPNPKYERANLPEKKGHFLSSRHKWLPDDADRLGNLVVKKKEDEILEILKEIEPRLRSLTVVSKGRAGVIYGDIGLDVLIPLPMMGGGINRLLSLALIISNTKDGVVLIDEIDSGFHYKEMANLWKSIQALANEYNVQVFATTHSIECIRAAYQVFSESPSDNFTLHRLDIATDGKISSVYYDQETLEAAIETGLEVR